MNIFENYTTQHRDSVAFVFRKYGVKAMPTPRNLQLAILAGKDTNFYQDLQNAVLKRKLGHNNYEDNYDYFLLDTNEESYDAETVGFLDTYEFDYLDRKAKKAARKQKRVARKEKRKTRRANKRASSVSDSAEDAQEVTESSSGGGTTIGEKLEKGMDVIGQVTGAIGGIAGSFGGGSGSNTEDGSYAPEDGEAPTDGTAKNYLPYIIGGIAIIAVIGVLIFVLKKKK